MLLAIDIGNSHTVLGLFNHEQLLGQWRFQSATGRTDDELAIQCHGLFSLLGIDRRAITGIILVSVVPQLQSTWISCCRKHLADHLQQPPQVISPQGLQGHLTIKTDRPGEVGADRLVNCIGARQKYQGHLIVIDFGTAITFDCLSIQDEFLGGVILPGINTSLEALATRTAKLPRIDLSTVPCQVIGTDTIQAMQSGILHGYGSLVEGLTQKISSEMGCSAGTCKVIATGGMAHLIAPCCGDAIDEIDPQLTLKGLCYLHRAGINHG